MIFVLFLVSTLVEFIIGIDYFFQDSRDHSFCIFCNMPALEANELQYDKKPVHNLINVLVDSFNDNRDHKNAGEYFSKSEDVSDWAKFKCNDIYDVRLLNYDRLPNINFLCFYTLNNEPVYISLFHKKELRSILNIFAETDKTLAKPPKPETKFYPIHNIPSPSADESTSMHFFDYFQGTGATTTISANSPINSVPDAKPVQYVLGHMIPSMSFRGFISQDRDKISLHSTANIFMSGWYLREQCDNLQSLNIDRNFDGVLWKNIEHVFAEFRSTQIINAPQKILTLTGTSMAPLTLRNGNPVSVHINTKNRIFHPNSALTEDPYSCLEKKNNTQFNLHAPVTFQQSNFNEFVARFDEFEVNHHCLNYYLPSDITGLPYEVQREEFLRNLRLRINVPERVWKMIIYNDDIIAASCANIGITSGNSRCNWENLRSIEEMSGLTFNQFNTMESAEETVCNFIDKYPPQIHNYNEWVYNPKATIFEKEPEMLLRCKMNFKNEQEYFEHWKPRFLKDGFSDQEADLAIGFPVFLSGTHNGVNRYLSFQGTIGLVNHADANCLWMVRGHHMIVHFSSGQQLAVSPLNGDLIMEAKNDQDWDNQKWLMITNDFVINIGNVRYSLKNKLGVDSITLHRAQLIASTPGNYVVTRNDWNSFFAWHLAKSKLSTIEALEFVQYLTWVKEEEWKASGSGSCVFDLQFYNDLRAAFSKVDGQDEMGIILCFAFTIKRKNSPYVPNFQPIFSGPVPSEFSALHLFIPLMIHMLKWMDYLRWEYLFNNKNIKRVTYVSFKGVGKGNDDFFSPLLYSYLKNNYYEFFKV
ncbi:hypothetical protein ROZALSC1DRAFT_22793, partial [Rozella allomycis CSF55]